MKAFLNITSSTVSYTDTSISNNPLRKPVDYGRSFRGLVVENPECKSLSVAAGEEVTIFDGSRTTNIDNTTEFDVSLDTGTTNRYRFTNSAGQAPNFRTDRALALNGAEVAVTLGANEVVTFTLNTGNWSPVAEGDILYIPGLATYDSAGPFSEDNVGFWVVLSSSGTVLQAKRPDGEDFSAVAETATLTADSQVAAFSPDGVQVGDFVDISAGFANATQQTYAVVQVTPSWFEIETDSKLPNETGIAPDATGMVFYTEAKRYVRLEVDQDCVVRANGDTGRSQKMQPWLAGDQDQVAEYVKTGPTWTLKVLNTSDEILNLVVISAA